MTAHALGWLVVVIAALGLVLSIYGFFRKSRFSAALCFCLVVLLSLLLVPAPIPGYPGELAPAFLVALFESFVQPDGKPMVALRILGMGLIVAVGLAGAIIWMMKSWIGSRREPPIERRLPPRRAAPARRSSPKETAQHRQRP